MPPHPLFHGPSGFVDLLEQEARFTGLHADGGYAEYLVVDERFAFPLPDSFNDAEAAPGDTVEIEISPGRVLVAAFALYMLPVLMTIVGFLVGNTISGGSEDSPLPIVLAIAFLVV